MKYLFTTCIVILTMACNHAEQVTDKATDTMASSVTDTTSIIAEPAITVEHYAGVIPCSDCTGIETEIDLKSDNTYMVHSIYLGRKSTGAGSNEFSENGTWMKHGADTIHLANSKNGPSMYIRTDSSLVQLDMKGNMITGKLADKYILKKK